MRVPAAVRRPAGAVVRRGRRIPARVHLAIISTPRSGNTWLRHLLGTSLALRHFPRLTPEECPWDAWPDRCALQAHWMPEDDILQRLDEHRFQVITLARHPLDVLVSLLQFDQTWHTGRGLAGLDPTSPGFLSYATGEG